MEAIDPKQRPVQSLDWGALKWLVSPDDTPDAGLTFREVGLLSGEGDQMLDDGGENWFPVRAGDTIYVPTAMFHATINTGWQPLHLLAIYNPGGAERVLRDLPDFREGDGPEWTVSG